MRAILSAALGSLVALVGLVDFARASATIDLIWAGSGTPTTTDVATSASITLRVILTAGPNGAQGAGVSVDYSEVLGTLSVVGYASTPGGDVPISLGTTIDTGSRIENINAGALPVYVGTGLFAGESHQLGTVTFHKAASFAGSLEIRSDANGPTDGILRLDGAEITLASTFNSARIATSATTGLDGPTRVDANPDGTFSYEVTYTPGPNEAFGFDRDQRDLNAGDYHLISDGFCEQLLPEGVPFLVTGGPISGALANPSYPGHITIEIGTCPQALPTPDPTASSLGAVAGDPQTLSGAAASSYGGIVHTTIVPFGADLCTSSFQCTPLEFCDTLPGLCGGDGVCVEVPQACTAVFDPVCGCDGQTYNNACEAARARVSVASLGPCPTPTPMSTPVPTPTPEPTCEDLWGVSKITTIGKGQSPSNNPKVSHTIFGHIVDPGSLKDTAHRIPVCAGTEVNVAVTDSTGIPTNTADGRLSCDSSGCSGIVNVAEKYKSVSADGKDTDRITLLPE